MLLARPNSLHQPAIAASTSQAKPAKKDDFVILKGVLTPVDALPRSGGRLKKFPCPFDGCDKLYARPSRLEEHVRSHTGEKPFVCGDCQASFARDSHLKAHLRSHMDESDKAHACEECEKKFWTNQHLKKHVEIVHRGKTYDCVECEAKFRKHHQLRTHIAEEHSPPGTLPFKCNHEECDKSFSQKVHLQAHARTHDPSRYACYHPECKEKPIEDRQFGTWTALQKHSKEAHPPKCPYPECEGKTFANRKNHMACHAKAEAEGTSLFVGPSSSSKTPKRRRRRNNRQGKGVKGQQSETDETSAFEDGSTTELETDYHRTTHHDDGPQAKRPRRAVVEEMTRKYRCPFPAIFIADQKEDEQSAQQGEQSAVEGEACTTRFEHIDKIESHILWIHEKKIDGALLAQWFDGR